MSRPPSRGGAPNWMFPILGGGTVLLAGYLGIRLGYDVVTSFVAALLVVFILGAIIAALE